MKVRIEASLTGEKSRIYEIDDLGNERELRNVRAATINVGVGEQSTIQMAVDLMQADVTGEMLGICKCINKDGIVKEVKKIIYKDGMEDLYD